MSPTIKTGSPFNFNSGYTINGNAEGSSASLNQEGVALLVFLFDPLNSPCKTAQSPKLYTSQMNHGKQWPNCPYIVFGTVSCILQPKGMALF